MGKEIYEEWYAGHRVRYKFQYPATRWHFRKFLKPSEDTQFEILAEPSQIEKTKSAIQKLDNWSENVRNDYLEYRALIALTSRELLRYDCCIFHSVSFIWGDKAFLLTAPSGTGKTTQYFNWQKLFPGEITMICGDMPVLERREDGSVWAHPTSWNGKENIGNQICAPLGGIVLLEQGKENRMTPLSASEAIPPFFNQFIGRPETVEQIYSLARLMDQMLLNVPCFKLINLGDDASTVLLRETLAPLAKGELS